MLTRRFVIASLVLAGIGLAIASQTLTIFVIQPMGAVPESVTLIISRREATQFIDSADAVCQLRMQGVNLFCRTAVLAGVPKGGEPLARLPYSATLYQISTGGVTYDR